MVDVAHHNRDKFATDIAIDCQQLTQDGKALSMRQPQEVEHGNDSLSKWLLTFLCDLNLP